MAARDDLGTTSRQSASSDLSSDLGRQEVANLEPAGPRLRGQAARVRLARRARGSGRDPRRGGVLLLACDAYTRACAASRDHGRDSTRCARRLKAESGVRMGVRGECDGEVKLQRR